jgi:NAD(P)-dependent dehydrogenase (short-subunit alcohol dehydrogenase family)
MKRKAVIITGASSGIGAATAEYFSNQGWFVFLGGRNEERLQQVALKMRSGASLLKMDLNNSESIKKYMGGLLERADVQIEALINNAAIYERKNFLDTTKKDWENMFSANLFGHIEVTQGVLPLFLKQGFGSIVNVSSTLGLKPIEMTSAYSASKAALINLTQSMALELGSKNIRVNCVCPGIVDTPIHDFSKMSPEQKSEFIKTNLSHMQPLNRIGQPEDIAKSIYFLASDNSAWTTGAVLSVDGGINIK